MSRDRSQDPVVGARGAAALVFFATAGVLVLEILSLRLVAPYVGLTLQTSTAVIGFALGAIATGAWVGGRVADRTPPERLLGPIVLVAGVCILFVGPLVRWTGGQVRGGDVSAVLLMAAVAVFIPAALLSAVTPMVVKLRLATLSETGTVVGRLSGIATLGALVATFVTGFLLVAAMPTSTILLSLGVAFVVVGAALSVRVGRALAIILPLGIATIGATVTVAAPTPCDVETAYHCARVVPDETRGSGRTLQLDTLSHSYVDLSDPTYLRFPYIRGMVSALEAIQPRGALQALHLGGGGLTIPRYIAATRPGSDNVVLEIDGGVVDLDVEELGLQLDDGIRVEVEDARVGLATEPSDRYDIVVGDAFGGLTVPWHLTTREAVTDIRRVLKPQALYLVNVIDYPPALFARAEVATIADVFSHVVLIARPPILERDEGGNVVIVASDRRLPSQALRVELSKRAPELSLLDDPRDVARFVDGQGILTDDFAPVDQLFTPYGER